MKALKIICIILCTLFVIGCVGLLTYTYTRPKAEGFTEDDKQQAEDEAKKEGEEYRKYLEDFIKSVEDQVNQLPSGTPDESVLKELAKLNELLQNNDSDMNSVTESKIAFLENLKGFYTTQKNNFSNQLTGINADIADAREKELGQDIITGLEYTKSYLENQIAVCDSNIASLERQITDIRNEG